MLLGLNEPVARARFGYNESRIGGVVFNFVPELPDENADVFSLVAIFRPPDIVEQLSVRQYFSGIGNQIRE